MQGQIIFWSVLLQGWWDARLGTITDRAAWTCKVCLMHDYNKTCLNNTLKDQTEEAVKYMQSDFGERSQWDIGIVTC